MMFEENEKPVLNLDVIALPPLKMVLVHAKDERKNRIIPGSVIENKLEIQDEQLESQTLMKIIEYLEKKS